MINWNCSNKDTLTITKIVKRAFTEYPELNDFTSLSMDITACHLNGNPLDLEKFLNFDNFNFAHDVFGIMKNIDRNNGKLTNCFLPRCTK